MLAATSGCRSPISARRLHHAGHRLRGAREHDAADAIDPGMSTTEFIMSTSSCDEVAHVARRERRNHHFGTPSGSARMALVPIVVPAAAIPSTPSSSPAANALAAIRAAPRRRVDRGSAIVLFLQRGERRARRFEHASRSSRPRSSACRCSSCRPT